MCNPIPAVIRQEAVKLWEDVRVPGENQTWIQTQDLLAERRQVYPTYKDHLFKRAL